MSYVGFKALGKSQQITLFLCTLFVFFLLETKEMLLAFTSQTFSWSTAFKPFIQQVVVISLSHQAYFK